MSQAPSPAGKTVLRAFGEEDLRLYLGPHGQPFVTYWERLRTSGYPYLWSWTWWGALFPVPWLFYRKLWAVGAALILLSVLIDSMIDFGFNITLVLGLVIGLTGKALVVERAETKTRDINDLGLVSQDSIDRLRRAGGVSKPGAIIGAAMMLATLGLIAYENFPNRLPQCQAATIREVVIGISLENAEAIGLPAGALILDQPRQVRSSGNGASRFCQAHLRRGGASVAIEYDILWYDRSAGRYVVDVRLRADPAE